MTPRYVCIHGHFYQPPRENPWLETIEVQDSAYPYHDWNERITAECYGPNAAARMLDEDKRIVRIVSNYSRMSFNFGPTLLGWLKAKDERVYDAILEADRESRARFSGHGSALAQGYNHTILPLSNERDQRTQILWGVRDFEHRFGRAPRGLWLPETAVDLATLDVAASLGVELTLLAPRQARRVRRLESAQWADVSGGRVDPSMPYVVELPSGRTIAVFFYDGPISQGVAFEGLLHRGEYLAGRLLGAFSSSRSWPQLVHIATDGETYGHHHRHGEMALAYALHTIDTGGAAKLTNYGEFLERHPPKHVAEIFENTSWSCYHGVERWRSDCGCSTGAKPGWRQAWRGPLREALDWLRDELARRYAERAARLFRDAWGARDAYIAVVLERTRARMDSFFAEQATHALSPAERVTALSLLEMQRHAMLMYTSCGWFFDDLSGIETVQVMQYAGRAVQLCRDVFDVDLEPELLARLEKAKSNVPEHRDGRALYERLVRASVLDLAGVAAHHAMTSVFEDDATRREVYAYTIDTDDHRVLSAGSTRVVVGRGTVTSEVTTASQPLMYGALYVGDHNLHAGVRRLAAADEYDRLVADLAGPVGEADLPATLRVLDRHFGTLAYSLKALFRDEQRRIVQQILAETLAGAELAVRQLHERHSPLMRFIAGLGMPLPRVFQATAELALNGALREALEGDELDPVEIRQLLSEARQEKVPLDVPTLEYAVRCRLARLTAALDDRPGEISVLEGLEDAVEVARSLPFPVHLADAQNAHYRLVSSLYPATRARAEAGDAASAAWVRAFVRLGEQLLVRVP